jgi:hypothetical protein
MGNKIVEGLSALTTSSQEVTPDILVMNFTIRYRTGKFGRLHIAMC